MLDVYYSNGNRMPVEGYIRIDNNPYEKLLFFYPSINWRFMGKVSKYVYLNRGKHTLVISRSNDKDTSMYSLDIDKIVVSFVTSESIKEDIRTRIYEAKEVRLDVV